LRPAQGKLKSVVVAGWTDEGGFYLALSQGAIAENLMIVECAKALIVEYMIGGCRQMTDTTQDDDDFFPATAGDDPIWLGGVEYITKSRSDELVKAGSVGMTEEQLGTIVIADSVEHEDGSATYTFDMDEASSKKVTELGLEFILTCAAYGLDIQDALELISTEGKMRELQKLGQEYDNG
jgi:hypothetical protein